MTEPQLPAFIWEIGLQLRRRRMPLGVEDYAALRQAMAAGFGTDSAASLRRLCVTLWAKSAAEAEIVQAAFARADVPEWRLGAAPAPSGSGVADPASASTPAGSDPAADAETSGAEDAPHARPVSGLASALPGTGVTDRRLVLVGQYPLTEREIAQSWRRLRRPLRSGPPAEIDVVATIRQRSQHAVATAPVLVPRRRNTARLLLLVDRYGSMTPFHTYVGHVVRAARHTGRIDDIREVFFHDVPGSSTDRPLLETMEDPFRPDLDPVLPLIAPLAGGRVYDDQDLTAPRDLTAVLGEIADGTAAVVISDAGAARRSFDKVRLLDTIALIKALNGRAAAVAWINPAKPADWARATAGQVARCVPMFPLTRDGLNRAVDTLRGHPAAVERPL